MAQIKHRRFLKEKEAAQIIQEFQQKTKININELFETEKPSLEVAETPVAKVYFINGKPAIANYKNTLIPTLLFDKALQTLPKITVNMGAIPHICNGADLMAPGVVKIQDNYQQNDYALVVDERHQKPLAIVTTLSDAQTTRGLTHGKIAKNTHYVGDALWNQLKNV